MSSLYIHSRHASSNQSNFTFPSILLYSFTESFECCQVQNVLLRDKLTLWIRSRNQRQLANGFITNPFINLGRHKAVSWFSQIVIRKKEKKKKTIKMDVPCRDKLLFSFILTTQHWAAVTTPTACLTSVQSMLHTSGRLTFRQHASHLLKPFSDSLPL